MRFARFSVVIFFLSTVASSQTAKFDMLDWMTMDPFGSHMAGSGIPIWTFMDSAHGKFYWVKSAKGFPWDVKSYDANFIYDTITEVNWSDPQTFKRHIGPNGKGYPISPRSLPYVPGTAPTKLWTITIPPSSTNFEIHSSCSQYRLSNLGYAKTEIWGAVLRIPWRRLTTERRDAPPELVVGLRFFLQQLQGQRAVHIDESLWQREMGKL